MKNTDKTYHYKPVGDHWEVYSVVDSDEEWKATVETESIARLLVSGLSGGIQKSPIPSGSIVAGLMTGLLADIDQEQANKLIELTDGWIEFTIFIENLSAELEVAYLQSVPLNTRTAPGTWLYEVVEPLGKQLADYILNGNCYSEFDWNLSMSFCNVNNQ